VVDLGIGGPKSISIFGNYQIMITAAASPSSGVSALFDWPRVRVLLIASLIISLIWMPIFQSS
jgi:hypothetical protein